MIMDLPGNIFKTITLKFNNICNIGLQIQNTLIKVSRLSNFNSPPADPESQPADFGLSLIIFFRSGSDPERKQYKSATANIDMVIEVKVL